MFLDKFGKIKKKRRKKKRAVSLERRADGIWLLASRDQRREEQSPVYVRKSLEEKEGCVKANFETAGEGHLALKGEKRGGRKLVSNPYPFAKESVGGFPRAAETIHGGARGHRPDPKRRKKGLFLSLEKERGPRKPSRQPSDTKEGGKRNAWTHIPGRKKGRGRPSGGPEGVGDRNKRSVYPAPARKKREGSACLEKGFHSTLLNDRRGFYKRNQSIIMRGGGSLSSEKGRRKLSSYTSLHGKGLRYHHQTKSASQLLGKVGGDVRGGGAFHQL